MDNSSEQLRQIVYSSLLAALIAAGAYIAIPIGPVPIVLQNLFVYLAGLLLGKRWGLASVAIYLFAGALGFPVFAGGTGGIGRLIGPTGGYLIGFLPAVYIIGVFNEKFKNNVVFDIIGMICGTLFIYALGITWLKYLAGMSWGKSLALGMYPFLLGDVLKMIAAIPIARTLRKSMLLQKERTAAAKMTQYFNPYQIRRKLLTAIRKLTVCAIGLLPLIMVLFLLLDHLFPLKMPENEKTFAITIVAEDGSPLRSFPDENGVWRYPIRYNDVSPLYIEALLNYEDRWFRYHPGVNPLSMIRALYQSVRYQHFISGGSTLTMQVARILHPHSKSFSGKSYQIFRAFQLEFHFTKDEILTLYLNYAPFGGPIEGVQAASYSYLNKPAKELSHAEAALLAVLPQSPTRFRPDRNPELASRGRDKVLDRMARFNVWNQETVTDAKMERVVARFDPRPMKAPLLARRLKSIAVPGKPIKTLIDPFMQNMVEDLVREFIAGTPDHTSAAVLIADNETLGVKTYVGSADFLDNSRYGHVDMITAYRSPGSTLKPFLYGFAIEEGLIHSESLMIDAPFSFSGYRPGNFSEGFSGPVSASEALQRSLNLPSVDLLDRIGPKFFDTRLRQGGFHLKYPPYQSPNLTMILGGVGATLENLVSSYRALACDGLSGKLRYTPNDPIRQKRIFSPGSAYIIRAILQEHRRPDLPWGSLSIDSSRQVAWKTGTSYGYRDAWTIGVTDQYTIGVWIGRPDGTSSPGQHGRATAAPLLFRIVDSLPRRYMPTFSIPDSVSHVEICWPLGIPPTGADDPHCHQRRQAWVLDGVVPPTLPDRSDKFWLGNPITILINPKTGLRVDADCPISNPEPKSIARWPRASTPWLPPRIKAISRIPALDPLCGKPVSASQDAIQIVGIEPDTIFRPPGAGTHLPTITLQAQGGKGMLFWLLNGNLIAESDVGATRLYQFQNPGRYQLTVMDMAANFDTIEFLVLASSSHDQS